MALGRSREQFQQELMVPTSALPRSPGPPFYVALKKLLAEAKFDAYVEGLCEPLYRDGGRPSVSPGVFFRMLFIGYFEGIDSQRVIPWRCSDSLSLRRFPGLKPTESTPHHSSLTIIRQRLRQFDRTRKGKRTSSDDFAGSAASPRFWPRDSLTTSPKAACSTGW